VVRIAGDEETYVRILAAHFARALLIVTLLDEVRGRRECRVLAAPMATAQRLAQNAR
jgi:hypothetical protein